MRLGEEMRPPADPALAVLDERLRAAQRDAMAAMTAIGVIVAALAAFGGWGFV